MGLDMYLERAPRYKNVTIQQIKAIDGYFDWKDYEGAQKFTLKEWCGVDEKDLPSQDVQEYYKKNGSFVEVGYWRKANAIHKWFVDNVQDGEDDCGYYEVDREQLEQLLHICNLIKSKCKLKAGKIQTGYYYGEDGERVPIMEDGMYIENPAIAQEYLPTQSGFFFGSTDYDEWYMQDVEDTIEILTKVLDETDFDTQMVVYTSSW